jgi:hypothetical protein
MAFLPSCHRGPLPTALEGISDLRDASSYRSPAQNVTFATERTNGSNFKKWERRGNVYENKGAAFHCPEPSVNVNENKGDMNTKQECC